MSPWTPFTRENVQKLPDGLIGVFQLAKEEAKIAYVGRADDNLRDRLMEMLDRGYTQFQWVQLPWTRETYEMQCRDRRAHV